MSEADPQPNPKSGRDRFEDYLSEEYRHIAEAHFRTIAAISDFFRYYLTIMALPLTAFAVAIGLVASGGVGSLPNFVQDVQFPLAMLFLVISLVGFAVLMYIGNLRMDALLYARTVNAVRKHFYDNSGIDLENLLRIRTLPQSSSSPRYTDYPYFLPVVLSFALFDALYLGLGLILIALPIGKITIGSVPSSVWGWCSIFIIIHVLSYRWYAGYREHAYLRSQIIGVDVDGVLNDHRKMFSQIYTKMTGRPLDPGAITVIPVHEHPTLGVKKEEAESIFNQPAYWVEMPNLTGAAEQLKRLRNALNIKVHIFTYRPFPLETVRKGKEYGAWKEAAERSITSSRTTKSLTLRFRIKNLMDSLRLKVPIRAVWPNLIDIVTRNWLARQGFVFDWLTIERGYDDVFDQKPALRNRFSRSKERNIRFFVEDDPEKATKLAYICDVVFLLEQPYNISTKVPYNVVRVKNWEEIYRNVRKFS